MRVFIKPVTLLVGLIAILFLGIRLLIPFTILLFVLNMRKLKIVLHLLPVWGLLVLPVILGRPQSALLLTLRSLSSILLVSLFVRTTKTEEVMAILKRLPLKFSLLTVLLYRNYTLFLNSLLNGKRALMLRRGKVSPSLFASTVRTLIAGAERRGNIIAHAVKLRNPKWKSSK